MTRKPRPAVRKAATRGRQAAASLTAALITALALLGLVAAGVVWAYQGPGPKAKQGAATTVVLRKGAGLPEIAANLEHAGVVGSASVFMAAAQISGAARTLKAGEYEFPFRTSLAGVLRKVKLGQVVRHFITIPEGVTSETVAAILSKSDVLSGVAPTPPEGAVLPETYEVQRGDDRAEVLQRMMDDRDDLLARLWAQRKADLPISTPDEAVTLASIVEKETGLAAERPRIAAVFMNRLRQGMRLESDPTIIYGLTQGRPLGRGLRLSELASDTPYNTYKIAGLPPTPICNPGRAALAAVLDPPVSDELFFVADGTGGHVFAATFEDHQKNVQKWRAVERDAAMKADAVKADAAKPSPGKPGAAAGDGKPAAKTADGLALR